MPEGRLRLRLVSQNEMTLLPGEILRILRHRSFLPFYLAMMAVLVAINGTDTAPALPIEARAPIYIAGGMAGFALVCAGLWLADRRARAGKQVVLNLSIIFPVAVLLGFLACDQVMQVQVPLPSSAWTEIAMDLAFHVLFAEISAGLAFTVLMPPILIELRKGADRPRAAPVLPILAVGAVDTMPAPDVAPTGDDSVDAPDLGETVVKLAQPVQIRVANRRFKADDILHIRAEGSHVLLLTRRGQQMLPGPFSAVVAQMPVGMGRQVSRSDWVATVAVLGWRVDGRDVMLDLSGGQALRVPSARRALLRDWLESISDRPSKVG